jgi:hypothetical protein
MNALVQLDIAKGRKELGWEIAYVALDGTTTASPTLSCVINNDADFVARSMMIAMWGVNGATILPPLGTTIQVRDSGTGNVMFRTPGNPMGFMGQPASGAQAFNGRFAANKMALPCPYLIRRGSSVFFEVQNAAGNTWHGDMFVGLEGFRVYPGQDDPIPQKITGYALPFSWNGPLVVPGSLGAGVQKLGTIDMQGPGVGHFFLKYAAVFATAMPNEVTLNGLSFQPAPDDCLALQLTDTQLNKLWIHNATPTTVGNGQYAPASFVTKGGTGFPWEQPRYLSGVDKMLVDVYGDPTAFRGGTPGTVEVQLNGVWVPS